MRLKEHIAEDLKAAMKAGDKTRLETLRTIRAALLEKEIDKRGSGSEMSTDDELSVLQSSAKKRRESIEQFERGGRTDLADQEKRELAIIQEYLPKQLSESAVAAVIDHVVQEIGAQSPADFGRVMPSVMKQLKGKADGKLIQEMVKKKLGGS